MRESLAASSILYFDDLQPVSMSQRYVVFALNFPCYQTELTAEELGPKLGAQT